MTETKSAHTPGPWRVDESCGNESVRAKNGRLVADCCIVGGGASVAKNIANARLIAAAPDLLFALEMIRDADNDCILDGLPQIPAEARRTIDAAIARATGDTP